VQERPESLPSTSQPPTVVFEVNGVRTGERMMDRGLYGVGNGVAELLGGSSITPEREPNTGKQNERKYNTARSTLEFITSL